MKMIKAQVTPLGSAGSATATSSFDNTRTQTAGKLYAVYLDYDGVAATTDVKIMLSDPSVAIFRRANSATDGWFFPRFTPGTRYTPVSTTSAQVADLDPAGKMLPIAGEMVVNVQGSTQVANGVTAYVYIEED